MNRDAIVSVLHRLLRHAFAGAKPFWIAVIGFAAAAVLYRLAGATVATGFLELAGLALVALDHERRRSEAGRPGLLAAGWAWLRGFPALFRRPRPIHLEAHLTTSVEVAGDLTVVQTPGPGATLEDRVKILEQELNRARQRHDRDLTAVTARVDHLAADVARERDERARRIADLDRKVTELSAGDVDLETVGLSWLTVGVVLSLLP